MGGAWRENIWLENKREFARFEDAKWCANREGCNIALYRKPNKQFIYLKMGNMVPSPTDAITTVFKCTLFAIRVNGEWTDAG